METFAELAARCAPHMTLEILAAVISLESGFNPFAVRANSDRELARQPSTRAEAIAAATRLAAEGDEVELGLGGLSPAQLRSMGLTLGDAFDPCANLRATASLLRSYRDAATQAGAGAEAARRLMLVSYYGDGDPQAGTLVGYDNRVAAETNALRGRLAAVTIRSAASFALPRREMLPAEPDPSAEAVQVSAEADGAGSPHPSRSSARPHWDVFAHGHASSLLVYSRGAHR
jgi:type IV secretion system protein VirB1